LEPFLAFKNLNVQFVIDSKSLVIGCRKNKGPEPFLVDVFFEITGGHGCVLQEGRSGSARIIYLSARSHSSHVSRRPAPAYQYFRIPDFSAVAMTTDRN
jgi:hypothetical protein